MTQQSSPLDTLTEIARNARDKAGQTLAGEQRTAQQVTEQLSSLIDYRNEYAGKLNQAMRDGIDPATMGNYQQFLASLDDALARARRALEAQEERITKSRQHWQSEQRRLSSYTTLDDRRQAARRRDESRREQHLNDDLVTMRFSRTLPHH